MRLLGTCTGTKYLSPFIVKSFNSVGTDTDDCKLGKARKHWDVAEWCVAHLLKAFYVHR